MKNRCRKDLPKKSSLFVLSFLGAFVDGSFCGLRCHQLCVWQLCGMPALVNRTSIPSMLQCQSRCSMLTHAVLCAHALVCQTLRSCMFCKYARAVLCVLFTCPCTYARVFVCFWHIRQCEYDWQAYGRRRTLRQAGRVGTWHTVHSLTLGLPDGTLWDLVGPCGTLWDLVGPCGTLQDSVGESVGHYRTLWDANGNWPAVPGGR